MSYTKLNYPAAFASEGNPMAGGFPGEFDPYVHSVKDTMDVDDDTGYFSVDVSLTNCKRLSTRMLTPHSTWRDSPSWQLLLP